MLAEGMAEHEALFGGGESAPATMTDTQQAAMTLHPAHAAALLNQVRSGREARDRA